MKLLSPAVQKLNTDKSPRAPLRDAAERLGVSYGRLRQLVVKSGTQPCHVYRNPNRYYYSLAVLSRLLKEAEVVTVQAAPAAEEIPAAS